MIARLELMTSTDRIQILDCDVRITFYSISVKIIKDKFHVFIVALFSLIMTSSNINRVVTISLIQFLGRIYCTNIRTRVILLLTYEKERSDIWHVCQ